MVNNSDPTKEIISPPESAINKTRKNTNKVDTKKINFEGIGEIFETIRYSISLVRNRFRIFLITIIFIYLFFIWGAYIYLREDYFLLTILIAGTFLLIIIALVYIDKIRIEKKLENSGDANKTSSNQNGNDIKTEDESEYLIFKKQYEEITLGEGGVRRQLNREIIKIFLANNTNSITRDKLLIYKFSPQKLNDIMNNNQFFEYSVDNKQVAVKSEWISIIRIAALWMIYNIEIEVNSKKSTILSEDPLYKDPFSLGVNWWDSPYNEILLFIIHICNSKTIDRTVNNFINQSQLKYNPQPNALIMASKIAEFRLDALNQSTNKKLITALRNGFQSSLISPTGRDTLDKI